MQEMCQKKLNTGFSQVVHIILHERRCEKMAKVRTIHVRLDEAKDKVDRLELQVKIEELKALRKRRKKRR